MLFSTSKRRKVVQLSVGICCLIILSSCTNEDFKKVANKINRKPLPKEIQYFEHKNYKGECRPVCKANESIVNYIKKYEDSKVLITDCEYPDDCCIESNYLISDLSREGIIFAYDQRSTIEYKGKKVEIREALKNEGY